MALRTPEFLQTKTYSAMRDRLALQHGGTVQAGVWDAGDFKVTQRAAGANMSVDVAVGFALVAANDPGNAGLYHVQNDATFNVTLQTNGSAWAVGSGTNPRIDRIVLFINDTTDGGDSSDTPTIAVVQGTATSGATLDNLLGASAVPTGALLLADALMPTSSTTVTTANIRDRRPWARGAHFFVSRRSTDITVGVSQVALDAATLQARVECSGAPLRATVHALGSVSAAGVLLTLQLGYDGVNAPSAPGGSDFLSLWGPAGSGQYGLAGFTTEFVPAAGSHVLNVAGKSSSGTATVLSNNYPILFEIVEDLRPNASNT